MKSLHYYLNGKERKEILEERSRQYIAYVAEQTGWDTERAKAEMDRFKSRGVNYRYYVKKRLWSREGKKLEISLRNIEKDSKYDKRSLKKHAKLVAEKAGWSQAKAEEKILEANLYTECSPRDYWEFRFWEKTTAEQKTYYTKGTVERLIMKYNTNLEEVGMIRSKDKFAAQFADLFGRVSFVNRKISYEKFLQKTEGLSELIVKPVYGTHGKGVEKFTIPEDDEEKRKFYDMLMEMPRSQIEEVIVQHHDIAAFCETSVNTVRVVTILDDNDEIHYMYSVLRMGAGGLIDGAEGGGLFAPVDVKTGIISRDGMNLTGDKFIVHPVSKKPIRDFQIPNWDKVLKLAEEGARKLTGAHMIGWDIAVTEEGAVLIEANSESNYQFAQLPYVDENLGVRFKFEPLL